MVRRAVFVFLLLFAVTSIASASNGVWRSIGPFDGVVNSIAIESKNSDTVYVANSAGIFKTTDGGVSWSSINPGVYPQMLLVHPRDSQIVFAGTINGLLKSVDGGATWHNANSGLGRQGPGPGPYAGVSALTFDSQNADILYAGTNVGRFKSVDGGESWVGLNAGLPTLPIGPGTVRSLAINLVVIDPRNPMTIYASGYDIFYRNGSLSCCVNALFKSTDGG